MAHSRARADDILPKASPASKYAKMAAHSPFAPPTAAVVTQAAPTPPPAPGWADTLTATMLVQDGNTYMVTVIDSQDPQKHLYLTSAPEDPVEPMAVASIKWGANREDPPTITLRKGKEFAQVRYESGLSALGTNNNLGGPPIPGGRNSGPGAAAAMGIRPPPLSTTGPMNQGAPGNAIRRPVIHSQPAPVVPVRPPGNVPANAVRPNPAVQADDDDDD